MTRFTEATRVMSFSSNSTVALTRTFEPDPLKRLTRESMKTLANDDFPNKLRSCNGRNDITLITTITDTHMLTSLTLAISVAQAVRNNYKIQQFSSSFNCFRE